jgi:molecular chaperone IbpA
VAGFSPDEVNVTAEQNMLTVEGRKADQGDHQYLYQGISNRPFRRQFSLADYVQVRGASFRDGLLQIELVCEVPEAMKPRRIAIESGDAAAESWSQLAVELEDAQSLLAALSAMEVANDSETEDRHGEAA